MMRTRTPRFNAATKASRESSSGTKYAADRSIVREAALMIIRYMSSMLSLPPDGELANICASPFPVGAICGK